MPSPASPAEYTDAEAMNGALHGCEALFLVSGRESANRVAEHVTAVDAAVRAGVQRIVYLSFLGAAPECTFTFGRDHWHTEQHIIGTGVRLHLPAGQHVRGLHAADGRRGRRDPRARWPTAGSARSRRTTSRTSRSPY